MSPSVRYRVIVCHVQSQAMPPEMVTQHDCFSAVADRASAVDFLVERRWNLRRGRWRGRCRSGPVGCRRRTVDGLANAFRVPGGRKPLEMLQTEAAAPCVFLSPDPTNARARPPPSKARRRPSMTAAVPASGSWPGKVESSPHNGGETAADFSRSRALRAGKSCSNRRRYCRRITIPNALLSSSR